MNKKPLWASKTYNNENNFLTMQPDGNLVVYSFKFSPLWQTNTSNGNFLMIKDNGNLVIYNSLNNTLWATNTTQIDLRMLTLF